MMNIREQLIRNSPEAQNILYRVEPSGLNGIYYDAFLYYGLQEGQDTIQERYLVLCIPQVADEREN